MYKQPLPTFGKAAQSINTRSSYFIGLGGRSCAVF
jgi:hypothetical protein